MKDSPELGLDGLGAAYRRGTTSPTEILTACLERIARIDPQLGAFTWIDTAGAHAAADRLGQELADGRSRGPLHGVPIAIKELFDVAGAPADYGSLARAGQVAELDSVVVARLRAAGAVIVGLTRSHEFGWGITTQHSRRGSTRNPWNLDRIPGGSSGGAAAAVAAGLVSAAIGTDTGGSIRIPSAFCGTAGIKPSYGRVPRTGLVPLAPSLDTVGVIAGRVRDVNPVLAAISGPDSGDPDSEGAGLGGLGEPAPRPDLRGVRLGHPALTTVGGGDARVRFEQLLARASTLGAEIIELDLPEGDEFREVFAAIQPAEAHHVHARVLQLYPARAGDYGDDVRGRIEAGARIGIGDYLAADRRRTALSVRLSAVLSGVDALLAPIAAVGAPTVAEPDVATDTDVAVPLRDAVMGFVVPFNLSGLPSVAVRAGFDDAAMPWGVQVVTARGQEASALAIAEVLERTSEGCDRRAVLA